MRLIILIILLFALTNCSKPKTVLVCGDHICVNKAEAEQFFEENLSIEVKILDNKAKEEIDLVKLNLKENQKGKKQISITPKKSTDKILKELSNEEIIGIKKSIKNKRNNKNKVQDNIKKISKKDKIKQNINTNKRKITNSQTINTVDVCTILEKCTIDEISKYLLEQAKKKDYPDITTRQ